MAKEKVTITLDRAKAAQAQALVGNASVSEVIDLALDRLIRAEQFRCDVLAYQRVPPTQEEIELAVLGGMGDLADDTDWADLYPEPAPE
ncbi:MAG TPA: type II toxin-antitoxin system VapB family antitoxin [Actinomycetota bacterium]|nr:type II toxin-antitoxin system VapB family antitoxin [Actinomycetota bacterium]